MSSHDQFENLMNQYSNEAAAEMEARRRAEKRRKIIRACVKVFFFLLLAGGAAEAYVNRDVILKKAEVLKMKTTAEMRDERKAKAEGKAVEAQKLGQKRVDEFESTLK